ncbi:MAG: ribosomal protein S18-alanine N-acetyltransferase [Lachnospiraceae bacterium]|nr:ribosomal protein S18-alanine N-acetyltransferase [Lachnospiraceae bacterium]
MNDPVTVRPFETSDLEAVAALEKDCFPDPWSEMSLQEMAASPHTRYLVAERAGRIVGYCGAQVVLDEGDILRIVVDETARRQGIGRALLAGLWHHTPEVCLWNLDVRAGNAAAQALYRVCGFVPVGTRKRYYREPTEDAILMLRKG